ncbi:MAG: hypothetical protein ACTHKL_21415, partial [Streptosporangiaceae bacterium]
VFDLDIEAARTAADLGLPMARAATPGTDPQFVALISSLVANFAAGARGEDLSTSWAGALGPSVALLCGEHCCRTAS